MNSIVPLRSPGRPSLAEGGGNRELSGRPPVYQPGKLMWWHDAIIDEMLADPSQTKAAIAHKLNKTPVFIYLITNSDLFKARYAQRRAEYEHQLGLGIVGKVASVASRSLDLILETLETKRTQVPLQQLESLADKTLTKLGYGIPTRMPQQPVVQVNTGGSGPVLVIAPATRDELQEARALIRDREMVLQSRSDGAQVPERTQDSVPLGEGAIIEGKVEGQASETPPVQSQLGERYADVDPLDQL